MSNLSGSMAPMYPNILRQKILASFEFENFNIFIRIKTSSEKSEYTSQ